MSANSEAVARFRERRRALVYDMLGDHCARCGATGDLEADHVDPSTKSFTISMGLQKRLDVFLVELAKCQHLCRACHVEKTSRENTVAECKNGHPKTGKNLVPRSGRAGYTCRECKNQWSRESKARKVGRVVRQRVANP